MSTLEPGLDLSGDVVPSRPAGARQPGPARRARGGVGDRALRRRPGHLGHGGPGPQGLAGRQRARARRPDPADHPPRRPPRGRAAGGRRPAGARRRRDDAVRPAPRRRPWPSRSSSSRPGRRTPWGRGWSATAAAGPTRCSAPSPAPGASTAGPSPPARPAPPTSSRPTPTRLRWTCWRRRWPRRRSSCPAPARTPPGAAGGPSATRACGDYGDERNRPDHDGTSRLSPYLHLGVLHPRSLLAEVRPDTSTYATELAWREFYADVLWHAPSSAWSDLKPALEGMSVRRARGRDRGVAHRHHRLPDRRRRDAPADARPGGCTTGCG